MYKKVVSYCTPAASLIHFALFYRNDFPVARSSPLLTGLRNGAFVFLPDLGQISYNRVLDLFYKSLVGPG